MCLTAFAADPAESSIQESSIAPIERTRKHREDEKQAELARLVAAINERVQKQYGDRVLVVSTWTHDEPLKSYYLRFKARLEKLAAEQFLKIRSKPVYGHALVLLNIEPNGSIAHMELVKSTNKLLGRHSLGLLQKFQPFEAFPAEISQQADTLILLVPFNYMQ
jgi:hypothetical protein